MDNPHDVRSGEQRQQEEGSSGNETIRVNAGGAPFTQHPITTTNPPVTLPATVPSIQAPSSSSRRRSSNQAGFFSLDNTGQTFFPPRLRHEDDLSPRPLLFGEIPLSRHDFFNPPRSPFDYTSPLLSPPLIGGGGGGRRLPPLLSAGSIGSYLPYPVFGHPPTRFSPRRSTSDSQLPPRPFGMPRQSYPPVLSDMPPLRRTPSSTSGFVDLTSDSPEVPTRTLPRPRSRGDEDNEASTSERPAKRRRTNGSTSSASSKPPTDTSTRRPESGIEHLDLAHGSSSQSSSNDPSFSSTTTDGTTATTATNATSATNASTTDPATSERPPGKIPATTCIICMDSITDWTATICGHVFCHVCLNQALAVSGHTRGSCPVCRKALSRGSRKQDFVPLEFMTRQTFERLKREGVGST